jgi:hypothetical protein
MNVRPRKYLAFLLRLWQVEENGCRVWRASLEDPDTGERRGFASLNLLTHYLREQARAHEDVEDIDHRQGH